MVFYSLVLQFYLKHGQKKKEDNTFPKKNAEEKLNKNRILKNNFKKDLMNLIEVNHQIYPPN